MAAKLDHCPACGVVLADPSPPRSKKQWGGFWRMIGLALDNWPENHPEIQPEGVTRKEREEHLRSWLLCKSGYRRILGERLTAGVLHTEAEMVQFAKALVREARVSHCFPAEYNGTVVVVTPKSMADITHEEFQPVFDEVLFLIEKETGIKIAFMKKELRDYERPNRSRSPRNRPADSEI